MKLHSPVKAVVFPADKNHFGFEFHTVSLKHCISNYFHKRFHIIAGSITVIYKELDGEDCEKGSLVIDTDEFGRVIRGSIVRGDKGLIKASIGSYVIKRKLLAALLKEAGITAMLTDVVALRVPHATGSLSKAMHEIMMAGVNVEYMYAFANGADASAILKSDAPEKVVSVLKESGFDVWEADEAYHANV